MPANDPHLDLIVRTTSGVYTGRWSRNQKAQHVHDEAVRKLGLASNVTYVLRLERTGAQLALTEKLGDLGLRDSDTIVLQAAQAKDG